MKQKSINKEQIILSYEQIFNEKMLKNTIRWSKDDLEFIEKERKEYERESDGKKQLPKNDYNFHYLSNFCFNQL